MTKHSANSLKLPVKLFVYDHTTLIIVCVRRKKVMRPNSLFSGQDAVEQEEWGEKMKNRWQETEKKVQSEPLLREQELA